MTPPIGPISPAQNMPAMADAPVVSASCDASWCGSPKNSTLDCHYLLCPLSFHSNLRKEILSLQLTIRVFRFYKTSLCYAD